jgi:hypothetical protein
VIHRLLVNAPPLLYYTTPSYTTVLTVKSVSQSGPPVLVPLGLFYSTPRVDDQKKKKRDRPPAQLNLTHTTVPHPTLCLFHPAPEKGKERKYWYRQSFFSYHTQVGAAPPLPFETWRATYGLFATCTHAGSCVHHAWSGHCRPALATVSFYFILLGQRRRPSL